MRHERFLALLGLVASCSGLRGSANDSHVDPGRPDGSPSPDGGSEPGPGRGLDGGGGSGPRANDAAPEAAGAPKVALTSADPLRFAAAQDGDGTWQAMAAGPLGSHEFPVTGKRYGIAYGCGTDDAITVKVIQATVSETTRIDVACGGLPSDSLVTLSGGVRGLAGAETARIDVTGRSATVTAAAPTYSLEANQGTRDVFARRVTAAPVFDRMIRKAATLRDGMTLDFDFTSEGFEPETHSVVFDGATASETTQVLVIFRNVNGGSPFGMGPFTPDAYLTLPTAELRGNDIHSIVASASDSAAGTTRTERRLHRAATSFTATLPPLPAEPAMTAGETAPYLRPEVEVSAGLYADRYDVAYTQKETASDRQRAWEVDLTHGWLENAKVTSYTLPDLSDVEGFDPDWALKPGVETDWRQFVEESSATVADLFRQNESAADQDGRVFRSTERTGQKTF